MTKTVLDALNEQIKDEIHSAYIYLSMSTWCEAANLPGFAHWLRAQTEEELEHAMKLRAYVEDRGGRVVLKAIDAPPTEFKSPLDLFQKVLEHERKISGLIHGLYALAVKENDYPSQIALQWFITEQVEEEKIATGIVEQLKAIGDAPVPLLMIDRQLAARAGS